MRRRNVAAGAVLSLTLAATTTELMLPAIAENRVRDELATMGSVTTVEVSTLPAVKLLFGGVDSVAIRMSSATLDAGAVDPEMLDRAGDVDALDAQIDTLRVGPFDVESVVLKKRGETLDAEATLDVHQIESLVPGAQLTVDGGMIVLSLAKLPLPLPLPGPVRFQIELENGVVVARPLGVLSSLLPAQALLDRPELSVTALHSSITNDVLTVNATATLTDL
jgi:hypothetical protein